MEKSGMRLKLLIDTSGKRVLFAEAGKDCVDFLFFILSLPISTIIRLLGKQQMPGSVANLYESIETLDESYIQPNISKDNLLKPAAAAYPAGYSVPLLLSFKNDPQIQAPTDMIMYGCSRKSGGCSRKSHQSLKRVQKAKHRVPASCYHCYVSDDPRAICPECGYKMSSSKIYVAPPQQQQENYSSSGVVKDVVTYMVMDDLVVKPMSAISSITLLTKFNINDVSALEEKVVTFGMNEAVKLLKASLVSKNVLTDALLF